MTAKIIVKCIIYNRALNRFLLVQRCENDHTGANTWENAGGNIEDGETPEDAVFREVKEETGITDIEIKKIAYVSILERIAQSADSLSLRNCNQECYGQL